MKPVMTIAERMDVTSKELAKRLFERRKRMREAIGNMPYKGKKVSKMERLGEYNQMRNDVQGWMDMMSQHFKMKEDGRVLVPKGMMQGLTEMEQELREGMI